MPHYSFNEDVFQEMREMSEEFGDLFEESKYQHGDDGEVHTYEALQGQFSPEKLEGTARLVFDVLRGLEATAIQGRYDGGGDEGFAHFEEAIVHAKRIGLKELAHQLADGPLGDVPDDSWISPASYLEALSRSERAKEALDWFAFALATCLLGQGYGTGEYSMYGLFHADLTTGRLIDIQTK